MIHRILHSLCALALAGTATVAAAYGEGGHFDTVASLLDTRLDGNSGDSPSARELRIEAFCTEISDLSREFDATTQRILVLYSPFDLTWGAFGSCQTPRSAHMVATQSYLHGLSGAPTEAVRTAATSMIHRIDERLQTAAAEDRPRLFCERGMAIHLLGDSFAHSRFSRETPSLWPWAPIRRHMYGTGLGHVRDGLNPDHLYGHSNSANMWPQMVLDVGRSLHAEERVARVLATHTGCDQHGTGTCDGDAIKELKKIDQESAAALIDDMALRFRSDRKGIGGTERASECQTFFDGPDAPAKLNCERLWRDYLELAVPAFRQLDIDPTDRPDADAAPSCSAWRCNNPGESHKNCTAVVITDRVSNGR